MLILSIYIATTYSVSLSIDKVELYHTSDVAVVLTFRWCAYASWLIDEFEEHT